MPDPSFQFEDFTLDLARLRLDGPSGPVSLRPKAFEVLRFLVENAGRVVANPPNDRSNWAEPNVDRSKWFVLPKKYERVDQSGITVEIKTGLNTGVDIELK